MVKEFRGTAEEETPAGSCTLAGLPQGRRNDVRLKKTTDINNPGRNVMRERLKSVTTALLAAGAVAL
ncbi:MAG TPA: hypothetical protein VNR65_18330, partial [Geobacterales bacterium]|nr:hypothetical protein [Geobacterales bacterium]